MTGEETTKVRAFLITNGFEEAAQILTKQTNTITRLKELREVLADIEAKLHALVVSCNPE